jgi:hypothetical protein
MRAHLSTKLHKALREKHSNHVDPAIRKEIEARWVFNDNELDTIECIYDDKTSKGHGFKCMLCGARSYTYRGKHTVDTHCQSITHRVALHATQGKEGVPDDIATRIAAETEKEGGEQPVALKSETNGTIKFKCPCAPSQWITYVSAASIRYHVVHKRHKRFAEAASKTSESSSESYSESSDGDDDDGEVKEEEEELVACEPVQKKQKSLKEQWDDDVDQEDELLSLEHHVEEQYKRVRREQKKRELDQILASIK